jgi:acetylornithine aminotransferase
VLGVRGAGLLLGVAVADGTAASVVSESLALGLVVNAPRPDTVRLAPSLLVTDEEIDEAVVLLGAAIDRVRS